MTDRAHGALEPVDSTRDTEPAVSTTVVAPSDAAGPPTIVVVAADERSVGDSPDVVVDVERWRRLAIDALRSEGAVGEVTLTFVDRRDIAELNQEHMDRHGPTDVLSFPMDDEVVPGIPALLGDIVLSPAVAAAQFAEHAGTIDDELALLVIHGVLHVLGHDHADPDDASAMRAKERELLVEHHWHTPPPAGFRHVHDNPAG